MLPRNTHLGELRIVEVYIYHDQPALFSCRNILGQLYLAVWVDETDEHDTWYYAPISHQRFLQIRSGGIDLYGAYRNCESGFVYEIQVPHASSKLSTVRDLRLSQVGDKLLPEPGGYLNIKTDTLPELELAPEEKAQQIKRPVINILLDFANQNRTEIPAKILGDALRSIQDTIDAIGNVIRKNDEFLIGYVSKRELPQKVNLMVTDVGAGSFAIELTASDMGNLLREFALDDVLDRFLDLLEIGDNEEALAEALANLDIVAANKYLNFLKAINTDLSTVNFAWGSPKGKRRDVTLSTGQISSIISVIERQVDEERKDFPVSGTLKGALLEKKTYEFKAGDELYTGRIHDDAIPDLSQARLNGGYIATIREIRTATAAKGEIKTKHILLSLKPYEFNPEQNA